MRIGGRTLCSLATLLSLALLALARQHAALREESFDAIIVLAGGVDSSGAPIETVRRRLQLAAEVHLQARSRGRMVPILCNGGGTTHKPKYVDANGYAVPEAALMARYAHGLGVAPDHLLLEGYSDDTLGNAYFARVIHADPSTWTRLLVITSAFQMDRTRAIYDWVFSLAPIPAGKGAYVLRYRSASDAGAVPRRTLARRREKEAASLAAFNAGPLPRMATLAEVHGWMHTRHSAYTWQVLHRIAPHIAVHVALIPL